MDLNRHSLSPFRTRPRVLLLRALACFFCVTACCAAAVLNPKVATADATKRDEYSVKAAYIYNLAKFVGWPSSAFAKPKQPLELCVLGRGSLRQPFSKLDKKSVQGHPLKLRFIKRASQVDDCHVVFIADTEADKLNDTLTQLAGKAVLTVSDIDSFVKAGGMISLIRNNNKIGFNVNVDALDQASLTVSSKLLRLAKNLETAAK